MKLLIQNTLVLLLVLLGNAQAGDKITFYHYDLQGSPVATTNEKGAKVAYDSPHKDLNPDKGQNLPHVGWQSGGKQPSGGHRGNNTYDGETHPSRGSDKGDSDEY